MDKKARISEERAYIEREMARMKARLEDLEREEVDESNSQHGNDNGKASKKQDDVEQIANRLSAAGLLLKDASDSATELDKLEKQFQAKAAKLDWNRIWKNVNQFANVVGSTAKVVGLTTTLASLLFSGLPEGTGSFGTSLWGFGSGVKIASNLSEGAREFWESYLKQDIEQYLKTFGKLMSTLQKFWEIVEDMKNKEFTKCLAKIEEIVIGCAQNAVFTKHAICVVLGFATYSPLFDFELMITDRESNSKCLKIAREIEGWGFTRFLLDESKPKYLKPWALLGSPLHYAVEMYSLMKDIKELTNTECDKLQSCVNLFLDACQQSRPLVSFLLWLHEMKPENEKSSKKNTGGGKAEQVKKNGEGNSRPVLDFVPRNPKQD